jgi:hypothetical protein
MGKAKNYCQMRYKGRLCTCVMKIMRGNQRIKQSVLRRGEGETELEFLKSLWGLGTEEE